MRNLRRSEPSWPSASPSTHPPPSPPPRPSSLTTSTTWAARISSSSATALLAWTTPTRCTTPPCTSSVPRARTSARLSARATPRLTCLGPSRASSASTFPLARSSVPTPGPPTRTEPLLLAAGSDPTTSASSSRQASTPCSSGSVDIPGPGAPASGPGWPILTITSQLTATQGITT